MPISTKSILTGQIQAPQKVTEAESSVNLNASETWSLISPNNFRFVKNSCKRFLEGYLDCKGFLLKSFMIEMCTFLKISWINHWTFFLKSEDWRPRKKFWTSLDSSFLQNSPSTLVLEYRIGKFIGKTEICNPKKSSQSLGIFLIQPDIMQFWELKNLILRI